MKVGDESTSKIRFRTTAKGNFPHLYHILNKLEPLGKEFNTVAYYVTRALLFIELQKGKEYTKQRKYHLQLGATASCTKIMTEATKGIGQRYIKGLPRIFSFWQLIHIK